MLVVKVKRRYENKETGTDYKSVGLEYFSIESARTWDVRGVKCPKILETCPGLSFLEYPKKGEGES